MKRTAVIDKNICVACGACAKACPKGAISIWRGCHALVDSAKCVRCGLCASACPAVCISLEERSAEK
ncbi:MAG: 4Fe-4S binding protein [Oscillospiraceae bacterium]|nr:4Fe-4S binding protein [Oscillospiraceae bacterium]